MSAAGIAIETSPRAPVSGVYTISLRRGERDAMRAAAYAHVGMSVDGIDQASVVLAAPFLYDGFSAVDLMTLIDNLHLLATTGAAPGGEPYSVDFDGQGGVDSEGRATDLYLIGLGAPAQHSTDGTAHEPNWLACAEAAHATWPHLFDTLGASVGGVVIDGDGDPSGRPIRLSGSRVPKSLRLKSGWDYDADGNQVWLPIEEAWRRFVEHNETRGERLDAKTMRKMRRHMEGFYADRAAEGAAGRG